MVGRHPRKVVEGEHSQESQEAWNTNSGVQAADQMHRLHLYNGGFDAWFMCNLFLWVKTFIVQAGLTSELASL